MIFWYFHMDSSQELVSDFPKRSLSRSCCSGGRHGSTASFAVSRYSLVGVSWGHERQLRRCNGLSNLCRLDPDTGRRLRLQLDGWHLLGDGLVAPALAPRSELSGRTSTAKIHWLKTHNA